jgi:hexosaminidase
MKNIFTILLALSSIYAYSQPLKKEIAIIPEPVSLTTTTGEYVLPSRIFIHADGQPQINPVVNYLKQKLTTPTGYRVTVTSTGAAGTVHLVLNKTADASIHEEGYKLSVKQTGVTINANTPNGLFYGVQTLLQLLPKEIESATAVKNTHWVMPAVEITDYPRFKWRGLMFDVSRHFFTKQEVMQFIDDMVRYKYNLLHLHLTDDEGWRIEIKGLPKLTEVGAWRVEKTGYFGTFSPPLPGEPKTYGGFFTQQDIKDLVQYAKERYVDILPEIDVPGHSLAAIVSYPELSCTAGADKYNVRSGEPIKDWSHGAPPIALVDDNLCPAKENVYEFLDKVVAQLAELFPFQYIHMGGDETSKNLWEKDPAIKALMDREGLKTMQEVQSYFSKRVEKIVMAHGKKFMGWDEILEGGLAPSAAVMSWQGMKGGIEAAKMGHEVVMSPTTYCYLDYMQGDSIVEPRIYATLRLSKAYEFDPMPAGVDPKYILGGQGNLWTEQITNMRHAQYMLWPRGFALAESLWSPPLKKSWPDFFHRVEQHFQRYDVAQKKYAPSVYDPMINVTTGADGKMKVSLQSEAPGLDVYYTWDNSFPDRFYPKYTQPLVPPKDAYMLRFITYEGNKPVGRLLTITMAELNKRAEYNR